MNVTTMSEIVRKACNALSQAYKISLNLQVAWV